MSNVDVVVDVVGDGDVVLLQSLSDQGSLSDVDVDVVGDGDVVLLQSLRV